MTFGKVSRAEAKVFLQTERLRLRELVFDDVDDLVTLNSDPEVMRYIHPGKECTPETERQAVKRIREACAERPGYGVWAVETLDDGKFIGLGLFKPLYNTGEIEVGYRLLPSAWSKGYATEIARALVRHGFETLGLDLIVGITMPENLASRRVLIKAGLEYKGERSFPECKDICPALSYYQARRAR